MKETTRSLMSRTSLLCASSRYLNGEANICPSWRTSMMTTFHMSGTSWTRYTEQWHYKISWRRPNGTSLPRLRRTSTSCTLTQRAFLSPSNCFSKGASTTKVCLTAASHIGQEGEGTSVTSTVQQSTLHDIVHVLVNNSNYSCYSIWRTYNVGTSLLQY
jgi:hypothetical protein